MSELSKQALKVDNNQSFPNNNAGLITPTALRTFNENMIDSLVDELSYNVDSGSWNQQINALEQFTASASGLSTGSLLVTASAVSNVMTFTKGDNSTFNVTVGSVIPSGTISSSQQISGLGFVSSSVTGSSLVTASFASQNLTFTKGDGSQFSLFIPDNSGSVLPSGVVSGSAQISGLGFQTTASFNTYTSSNDSKVNSLINATSSYAISSSVAAVDAGQQLQINSLIAATSSYATSAITASSLITASFSGNTLTFTKGNGTTFGVVIPDVSGSTLPSGLVSGSSQIILQQTTGLLSGSRIDGAVTSSLTSSLATNAKDIIVDVKNTTGAQINKGTVVRIIGATGDNPLIGTASWENDSVSANTLGFVITDIPNDSFGRVITQGTLLSVNTDPTLGYSAGQLLYLSSSGQYTNIAPPAPFHEVRLGQVMRAQQNNGSIYVLVQNGYELSELHDVNISTGSLANNNLLAYNSTSQQWENKTLAEVGATSTSSFNAYTASQSTGSLLLTASFSGNTLTFTKADTTTFGVVIPDVSGSTIPSGTISGSSQITALGFAITGSNTFIGTQVITGSNTITTITAGALSLSGSSHRNLQGPRAITITKPGFDYPVFEAIYTSASSSFLTTFTENLTQTASYTVGVFDNGFTQDVELSLVATTTHGVEFKDIDSASGLYKTFLKIAPNGGSNPAPIFTRGLQITGSVGISGTLTASLQEGFVLVGNAAGRTTNVATSSFGGGGAFPFTGNAQISGSLGVTGSMSGFVNTLSVASSTASVNFNDGNMFTITLPTGSVTHITPTNIRRGQTCNIQISQASSATTGSVTFSPNVLFAGGNDYQVTATGSAIDLLTFVSLDGTNVLGTSIKNFL